MKASSTKLTFSIALLVGFLSHCVSGEESQPKVYTCKARYASNLWIKRSAPPATEEYQIHQIFWIEIYFPDVGVAVVHPISHPIDYFTDDNSDTPQFPYTFFATPERYAARELSIPPEYRLGPYMKCRFEAEELFLISNQRNEELRKYFEKHRPHKLSIEQAYLDNLTK